MCWDYFLEMMMIMMSQWLTNGNRCMEKVQGFFIIKPTTFATIQLDHKYIYDDDAQAGDQQESKREILLHF